MMRIKKISAALLAAAVQASALPGGLWAVSLADLSQYKQGNIKVGLLELHPYYTLSETYDSNIYLAPRDQPNGVTTNGGVLGSWITQNILGLDLNLPVGHTDKFSGGYAFQDSVYTTQPSVNNNTGQKANIEYDHMGPNGLAATLKDNYINTTDRASSELIQRQRRWNNTASGALTYSPPNSYLVGGVDASDSVDKYLTPGFAEFLNRNQQRYGLHAGYKVQPLTEVYAAYHRDIIHYSVHDPGDSDQDSKAHDVSFGVQGTLLPTLTGKAETGVTFRQYDGVSATGGGSYTKNWIIDTQLLYQFLKRTSVSLNLQRSLQESIFGTSRYYISTYGVLDVKHKFPRKLTADVYFGTGVDKYPDVQTVNGQTAIRRDDLYQEGASLQYEIQAWLSATLSYTHLERDSIFSGLFNYEDHLTTLSLTARL